MRDLHLRQRQAHLSEFEVRDVLHGPAQGGGEEAEEGGAGRSRCALKERTKEQVEREEKKKKEIVACEVIIGIT